MVSTSTDRNHALYIDVLVTNRPAVEHTSQIASKNTPDWSRSRLEIVTGRFKRKRKQRKVAERKDVCLLRGFETKKTEVAVPRLVVQLGTTLRKAQSLVNVGGGVDFIQANMFLDPAHLN